MRLVKVKQSFYNLIKKNHVDVEILFNECGRPCVLIMDLEYKGLLRKFVVPLCVSHYTKRPVFSTASITMSPALNFFCQRRCIRNYHNVLIL